MNRDPTKKSIPSKLDPIGTSPVYDCKRPDGTTLIPWSGGRAMVWDGTCVDVFAKSNLKHSLTAPRKLSKIAEERKLSEYSEYRNNYIVKPLAFDTLGGFGPNCLETVKEIGREIEENTGKNKAATYLMQRISIEIVRGNAASILGSMPRHQVLEEIFDM